MEGALAQPATVAGGRVESQLQRRLELPDGRMVALRTAAHRLIVIVGSLDGDKPSVLRFRLENAGGEGMGFCSARPDASAARQSPPSNRKREW